MSFDQMNLNYDTQIERALEMLNDLYSQHNSEISYAEYSQLHDAISSIPTAEQPVNDVKPVVRGEWVRDPQTGLCVCSNCGKVAPYEAYADRIEYWPVLDFCPACGADMRERSEE